MYCLHSDEPARWRVQIPHSIARCRYPIYFPLTKIIWGIDFHAARADGWTVLYDGSVEGRYETELECYQAQREFDDYVLSRETSLKSR